MTDSIVAIPSRIAEWLSQQSELSDIRFFTEFPPVAKAVPLRNSIVAVGIEEMKIVDKFVMNDDEVLERQEYCRTAQITMRLSICVPYSSGGPACHDIFTNVIDALTFRTDLNISESSCDEIQSDRDTSALVLTGRFLVNADFCPAESIDENYGSFLDKELLCGSHIRNDDIHVTAEDKESWNNPIATGFYLGTGSSSRTFQLGFSPKAIIVFCPEEPLTAIDFSQSTAKLYAGFATDSYGTAGLTITSDGFRVARTTAGGVVSSLNEVGISYSYTAFR